MMGTRGESSVVEGRGTGGVRVMSHCREGGGSKREEEEGKGSFW